LRRRNLLDEVDTVTETLESLGKVTADGDGDWSFTLARTLALTEGLRTASTTVVDGQILHPSGVYSVGTTTRISEIYTQTGAPHSRRTGAARAAGAVAGRLADVHGGNGASWRAEPHHHRYHHC
jgi:hypothetical protein